MNRMTQNFLVVCLFALCIASSCKKTTGSKTTCTSTLYGYTVSMSAMYDTISTCSFGSINPASGLLSAIGSFASSVYTNQGAYNTSDNCYYVFKTYMGYSDSPSPLYKISSSGSITAITTTGTSVFTSPVFNRVTNKLYCITGGKLAQITISGSTFTTSVLATPVHHFMGSLTVDNNTGDMYISSGDTVTYYIEKYTSGSSSTSVVATGTGAWDILGLRYNKNDNMLYAIRENYPASGDDFIKIDPATGTVTVLTSLSLPSGIDREFYSTCIDPCTNHYYISSVANMSHGILKELSMTGTVLATDSTATFIQSLDIN